FEFSALSELSAVAGREEEINAYLIQALPDRMITTPSPEKRGRLGRFFADLVIPEDFRKLTESAVNLTLEVDEQRPLTRGLSWPTVSLRRRRHRFSGPASACPDNSVPSSPRPPVRPRL